MEFEIISDNKVIPSWFPHFIIRFKVHIQPFFSSNSFFKCDHGLRPSEIRKLFSSRDPLISIFLKTSELFVVYHNVWIALSNPPKNWTEFVYVC